MPEVPPIPIRMTHLPTIAGLVVPWVTATMPDGTRRFGAVDAERLRVAIYDYRCGTCGQSLDGSIVFALRLVDVRRRISPEPGMHPECADYSARACPMLAGRMERYRSSAPAQAGVEHLGDPLGLRAGHAAEQWHLVRATGYRPIIDSATNLPAAALPPTWIQRVRPIT